MIGMECDREVKSAVKECLKRGFLINCTNETVLRFVPPLIVTTRRDRPPDSMPGRDLLHMELKWKRAQDGFFATHGPFRKEIDAF